MGNNQQSRGSGFFMFIMLVIGALFIVLPMMFGDKVPAGSQFLLIGFGIAALLVAGIIGIITKLYRKATSSLAFVRTGMGGEKVIIDGGRMVIPVIHNVIEVSLETMRLDVRRTGKDALITGDSLRADLEAEFYIKVQKDPDSVKTAATSLGGRSVDADAIKDLVEQKLISALRTVAATQELNDLHAKRDEFAEEVQKIVTKDLEANGLTLETVTVSALDQTPVNQLAGDQNIFDAKGKKKISQIIEAERVETVKIKTEADKQVKEEEVGRNKFIYQQEVEDDTAAAQKAASIDKARSKNEQEAATFRAAEEEKQEIARVKKEKAIELAEVEKQQNLDIANEKKDEAVKKAAVKKQEAIDIAEQEKLISVEGKKKQFAEAEEQRLEAETAKEEQEQARLKVVEIQTAERNKESEIIAEQAKIEKKKLTEEMEVDVKAYEQVKTAEAEEKASEAKAKAKLVIAKADKDSNIARAEGDKAVQMVPVEVDREQVAVEDARVEVNKKDLAAKAEFQEIAKELEIALRKIQAQENVGVEQAKSIGIALSQAEMKIFGDPMTVAKMANSFSNGQGLGMLLDGIIEQTPEATQTAIAGSLAGAAKILAPILKKIGVNLPEDQIESLLKIAKDNSEEKTTEE